MARTSEATSADLRGGPHLSVSWRHPGSKRWQKFENTVGRAVLAAAASGEATFQLEETVRRSPRNNAAQSKAKRACAFHRSSNEAKDEDLVVTLETDRDGSPASRSGGAIRWGFSSTCMFDRLPNTARALTAMIAECEAAKKRQVLSELLNFLTAEDRIHGFLCTINIGSQPVRWNTSWTGCSTTGTLRVSRIAVNERARPGGALYERFLDTMTGHVAELGGALQSLMGSASQTIAPLAFAFHGTPPTNVPSILENGMLPKRRVAGGDWFGTSPLMSLPYCQKYCGQDNPGGPPFVVIFFLLLPVPPVVLESGYGGGVIVMSNPHYELPVCTVELECDEGRYD